MKRTGFEESHWKAKGAKESDPTKGSRRAWLLKVTGEAYRGRRKEVVGKIDGRQEEIQVHSLHGIAPSPSGGGDFRKKHTGGSK